MSTHSHPSLPPFCTAGTDFLPDGPPPGTDESRALAAWEVLTGTRVARSAGSGRMSLLARHRREATELTRDRVVNVALHAFEGADERWAIRRARGCCATDQGLRTAVVQEMGGPAHDPDEMTTLGFWTGETGFTFDCRGPAVDLLAFDPLGLPTLRRKRISGAVLLAHVRRVLGLNRDDEDVGVRRYTGAEDQLVLL